jgi:hypothetical protein
MGRIGSRILKDMVEKEGVKKDIEVLVEVPDECQY